MKKQLFGIAVSMMLTLSLSSQSNPIEGVSINTTGNPPHTSSILDVGVDGSTDPRGLLIPRMTFTEMLGLSPVELYKNASYSPGSTSDGIPTPALGLTVYITDNSHKGFWYVTKEGTSTDVAEWVKLRPADSRVGYVPRGGIIMYNGPFCASGDGLSAGIMTINNSPIGVSCTAGSPLFTESGLGQQNTEMEGWAVCNGLNGTPDMRGLFVVGGLNKNPSENYSPENPNGFNLHGSDSRAEYVETGMDIDYVGEWDPSEGDDFVDLQVSNIPHTPITGTVDLQHSHGLSSASVNCTTQVSSSAFSITVDPAGKHSHASLGSNTAKDNSCGGSTCNGISVPAFVNGTSWTAVKDAPDHQHTASISGTATATGTGTVSGNTDNWGANGEPVSIINPYGPGTAVVNRPEYFIVVYLMKLHEKAYNQTITIYGARYTIPQF